MPKKRTNTNAAQKAQGDQKKNPTQFTKGNTKTPVETIIENNTMGIRNRSLDIVKTKKVDKALVDSYLCINSHLTVDELVNKLNGVGPNGEPVRISVLEGMLIKAMIMAYRRGDVSTIEFLLDRMIGRIPNKVALSLDNELADLSDEELLKRKQQYASELDNNFKKESMYNPRLRGQLGNASSFVKPESANELDKFNKD